MSEYLWLLCIASMSCAQCMHTESRGRMERHNEPLEIYISIYLMAMAMHQQTITLMYAANTSTDTIVFYRR